MIKDKKITDIALYSFDIFGTLLYRKVPHPSDIFTLMETDPRIKKAWPVKSFSKLRKETEHKLRQNISKEITIEDIYRTMQSSCGAGKEDVENTIKLEFDYENSISFLNGDIFNDIQRLVASSRRVILISDMYWGGDFLRKLLVAKNPIFANIPIYVSCDYGSSKKSGLLFRKIKKIEKIPFSHWMHTGDDNVSDFRVPKLLGIKCRKTSGQNVFDFEKNICSTAGDVSVLKTYGVMLTSRQGSNGSAYDLGASFAGPMVYQYVDWVIQVSLSKRISHLYFVMRDGYILKKVADLIITAKKLSLKTDYIFGSRVSWRFPELTIDKLRNISLWDTSNWIFHDPCYSYVAFERLSFSKEELSNLFGADFSFQKLRSFSDFKQSLDFALNNEQFDSLLNEKIRNSKEMLKLYFSSLVDFSESFAFVDTNSTGKTQNDLNGLFQELQPGSSPIRFFYHTFLSEKDGENNTRFAFINGAKKDFRFPEALFRAPYNTCYGYQKNEENVVVPKFFSGDKCAWFQGFDYDSYLSGILAFSKNFLEENDDGDSALIDSYCNYLLDIANINVVSRDILSLLGDLPFNPDVYGNEILPFYPKIRFSFLFHPFSKLIYCPKGSFYRSGHFWRFLYRILFLMVKIKRHKS